VENFTAEGNWWHPDAPDRRIGGTLVAEGSRLRLVLHDALRRYKVPEAVDGVIHHEVGGPERVRIETLHGYTRDRRPVTLFGAVGTAMYGPFETVTEVYDVDIVLEGGHLDEDSFKEIIIEFDWLDAWLDPPSIIGDDLRAPTFEPVDRMPLSLAEVDVEGARIAFRVNAVGEYGSSSIHFERVCSVRLDLVEASTWRNLLDEWARPVQDFLTVAIGQTVEITSLKLRAAVPDPRFPDPLTARFRTIQAPTLLQQQGHRSEKIKDLYSFSAPTIFTARMVEYQLQSILDNWFKAWPEITAVTSLLLAHMYAPFMYTSQRYGSIFQAVERLHSILYPTPEKSAQDHQERVAAVIKAAKQAGLSPETATWAENVLITRNDKSLTQRTDEVISGAQAVGERIFAATADISKRASRARGGVAHPKSGRGRRISSAEQYWLGDTLWWVTRSVLIHYCGLQDSFDRAAANFAFQQTLELLQAAISAPEQTD
jgi:hypothetical protein